jgi:hypothetical protein
LSWELRTNFPIFFNRGNDTVAAQPHDRIPQFPSLQFLNFWFASAASLGGGAAGNSIRRDLIISLTWRSPRKAAAEGFVKNSFANS